MQHITAACFLLFFTSIPLLVPAPTVNNTKFKKLFVRARTAVILAKFEKMTEDNNNTNNDNHNNNDDDVDGATSSWTSRMYRLTRLFGGAKKIEPEAEMQTMSIIRRWEYPAEQHDVITNDGYILEMHRIPHGKKSPPPCNHSTRPVVFFQHGLVGSSADWVQLMPWQSAAFLCADAGFDVWLGNFRGNTYARTHQTLDASDDEFWAFSFDEMAAQDLPAMLHKVIDVTGAKELTYVGHSMGTMTAFALFSKDLELAAKVKRFFGMAPIGQLGHIGGLLSHIAPLTSQLTIAFKVLGGYGEFLPSKGLFNQFSSAMCRLPGAGMCDDALFLICGPNSNQINQTRLPVHVAHTPAGTSVQNVVHFGQNVNSGKFLKFDYGKRENRLRYGQDEPPEYDISNMTVPTYLFSGELDILANPTDMEYLLSTLPAIERSDVFDNFNHMDFIWGVHAPGLVYHPMLEIMKEDLPCTCHKHCKNRVQ